MENEMIFYPSPNPFLRMAKAAVLAALFSVPAFSQYRMGQLTGNDLDNWGCAGNVTAKLDYMRNLGYTHVLFPTIDLSTAQATRLQMMRYNVNAILSRNMIPVPQMTSFTHMGSRTQIPKVPGFPDLVVPADCSNPANEACIEFDGVLGDIQTVWSSTPGLASRPPIINIGHDEAIPPAATLPRPTPPSSAAAAIEIAARIAQIDKRWPLSGGPAIKVAFYGDSFLPNDNGVVMGWVGNAITGVGGVLDLLTKSTGQKVDRNRIIVMPWAYGANGAWVDGAIRPDFPEIGPNSRYNQVAYLNNLGIPFVIATGENGDGACTSGASVQSPETIAFHKEVFYEWAEAVTRVGGNWFRGYASHIYSDFHQSGSGTQVGYLMPFIRHAEAFQSAYVEPYWAGFYVGFPYVLSRQTSSFDGSMLVTPFRKSTYFTIIANSL